MQCFICGEPMRVVKVEPHVIDMQGFELRTFQCVGCGDVEKHPVFDRARSPRPSVRLPEALAVPGPRPPGNKVKTILGNLVRLRNAAPGQ